jgi:hypothetical protein
MKYRDIDIFFRKNIDTNDIILLSDSSSIIQSVKNIVLTRPGEKPFNFSFGTELVDTMFDQPSLAQIAFLQSDIYNQLVELEPRISVEKVEVVWPPKNPSDPDITVNIDFKIISDQLYTTPISLTFTVTQ